MTVPEFRRLVDATYRPRPHHQEVNTVATAPATDQSRGGEWVAKVVRLAHLAQMVQQGVKPLHPPSPMAFPGKNACQQGLDFEAVRE